ncbi:hypothetical protein [Janthinobacterium sp. J1-1]|uniref:hypothetical protein n=1 Tax=Janthinobacterium sp. J1-1 TaxID=3065910 RepID=UPI0028118B2F|nr:hypothetical protein [Janthinobacterium sp. J1-1]
MKKMTLNAIAVMLLASLSTFSIAAVPDSNPAAHSGHQHGANEQSASLVGKAGDPKKATRTVTVDMRCTVNSGHSCFKPPAAVC